MSLTTTGGASILTPDQVDALIVRPFSQESVALRTSTVVPINPHTLRIPVVTADPVAGFVAEGAKTRPPIRRSPRSTSPRPSSPASP